MSAQKFLNLISEVPKSHQLPQLNLTHFVKLIAPGRRTSRPERSLKKRFLTKISFNRMAYPSGLDEHIEENQGELIHAMPKTGWSHAG